MKRNFFVALALALVASVASAQFTISNPGIGGPNAGSGDLVKLSLTTDRSAWQPNEAVRGEISAVIEPGWHINSVKPVDEFSIATTLDVKSAALSDVAVQFPEHELRAFSFSAGGKLAVYEGTVKIPFTAKRTASPDTTINVHMRYQACNDSVCLPPREVNLAAKLGETVAAPSAAAGGTNFTPLSAAPKETPKSIFSGDVGAVFESHGLFLTLLVIFVLGIALNLTPCVYPLIPITLAFFASQTEGKRSRQISLALTYVIGIAVTYSALGAFSALSGALFGAWLQSPAVLAFFAVLMLVLSASMFGLYEIKVPHFVADRAGARAGYIGAMTMGLLAGVVAAPCVGPVVISLIAFVGQRGEPLLGVAMFFALALGLGFPYLIGISSLPRAGAWMVTIKKALGFVLIAMAFYFLRSIIGDRWYALGVTLSLAIGAIYLLVDVKKDIGGRALKVACALLLIIGSGVFIPSVAATAKPGVSWDKYSEERLSVATRTSKPVIIDFYADWCLPCKELDEKTFRNAAVIEESDRFIRLKADLTRTGDAATEALTKKYNIVGVPTIVFLGSDGREIPDLRLTGFEAPDRFLQRMKSAK